MAMFLHRLDDHLDDGEVPATHLVLLLRSEAWRLMIEAFGEGAAGDPEGASLAERFIADYYEGMTGGSEPDSLEGYCALFRKQMATWLVAPVLLARRADDSFAAPVRAAYESFGIAWRLLDDMTDAREDAISGARSSVYLLLSREGQRLWRDFPAMNSRRERSAALGRIGQIMEKRRVAERLAERIDAELENAAIITGGLGMGELASQYRAMAAPMAPRRGAP
jgi:hypothetical protein